MATVIYELQIGDKTFKSVDPGNPPVNPVGNYLHGIRFNRKIYQPGEIEAEISIKPKCSVTEAVEMLLRKGVTLKMNDKTIATNYYVHEILPQKKKDDAGELFMKVSIFSMDKLMTLDKYSKVYVAKKLGSEILDVERNNFILGNATVEVGFADMCMLKYTHTKTLTNNMTGKSIHIQIPSEFIHPYLVQYNESFYDFMARTANRCGEFLYFEDGRLNLGLPTHGNLIEIKDYSSLTYQNISAGALEVKSYARDSIKDNLGVMESTNYDVVKKNAAGYPHDAFPSTLSYNSELAHDEYFFPLYADKFSTFAREMGLTGDAADAAGSQIFPLLYKLLSGSDDYAEFLMGLGYDEAKKIYNCNSAANGTNQNGFKNHIAIKDTDDRAKKLELSDGQTSAVPFGTLSPEGWTTLNYYRDVRKYEEEQQLKMICIDMDTSYVDVKLGAKISLPEEDDLYTVVQILMVDGEWCRSYAKYDGSETHAETKTMQNQKIFAIPYRKKDTTEDDNVNLAYPPVLDVPIVRKAEPQTAFITANDDPKYQGRVRIVYPWQTESKGKLKALANAEDELAEAQKALAEKQSRLAQIEVELNALKTEQADLESLHEEKDRKNSLKRRQKELEKTTEEITSLKTEITNLENNLTTERNKAEKEQDKSKIEKLELEIRNANNKKSELEVVKADQDSYIAMLKEMQDDDNKLTAKKQEVANAIAVKDSSGKLTGGKQKEYNDMMAQVKTAKEEVQKKKKNVEDKVEDGMKALSSISSPWIRVTTPMATEGGGTFFKPRVGDEVLVSYDNGNVERPYVIGSLFSKNVLAPDERINRTVGPDLYANASIAIVSPNGHGITFKDPSSGAGFFSSTYPGLGVVNSFTDIKMPHTKDVAGGIKIGDRYGLYSISMSSDKRSINISSSMGKVSINAFTGITISAPAGDIKIEGKNVSISAGNNLSITSGTNIKGDDGFKRDTKLGRVTEFLTEKSAHVSDLVNQYATPFIDTSLARASLEVFLRPIEGTLCVKSKRYLTLEAGSGKAMIKRDRFKKYNADDEDRQYDFFRRMISCLTPIGSNLDKFCDTYVSLWKDAFGKYAEYELLVPHVLKDPKDPALLKIILQEMSIKGKCQFTEDFFSGKLDDSRRSVKRNKKLPEHLCKIANALEKSLAAMFNHMNRMDQIFNGAFGSSEGYIESTLKEVIFSMKTEAEHQWEELYLREGSEPTDKFLAVEVPEDAYARKAYLKRMTAALFLLKVAEHPEHVAKPFIKPNYKESDLTEGHLNDNYWWSKFAVNFDGVINPLLRTLLDNTLGTVKDSLNKNFVAIWKLCKQTDRDVWADGKGGQILFSDQKDATVNFDGGDLKVEEDANRYNIDRMKKVLSGL